MAKSIYQIAQENGVSKQKVRAVILQDLSWDMSRFQKKGRMILISEEDEEAIVERLSPIIEKKAIPKASLYEAIERLNTLELELKAIKDLLCGIKNEK